jgi:exosortase
MSLPSVKPEAITSSSKVRLVVSTCTIAVTVALYFEVFKGLFHQWFTDSNFSHGLIVPFFCGWVVWLKRKELAAIPVTPSSLGLVPITLAIILLTIGNFGAELFTARISIIVLIAGLVIFLLGWRHFHSLLFVICCMFLMVPIPAIIFNQITLPLQSLAAQLAASILELLGTPVLREGNIIQLASMPLEVAEACSGIRSLLSLGTLAIIFGYLSEPSAWKRVVIALASIPIAVGANAVRIVGTGLAVQFWDPDKALGFFHEFSGWLIFLFAFGAIMIVQKALQTHKPDEHHESPL